MSCCLQAEGDSGAAVHFALVMQQLLQVTPLFQVLGGVNTEADLLDDEVPEPTLAGAQSGQLVNKATAFCVFPGLCMGACQLTESSGKTSKAGAHRMRSSTNALHCTTRACWVPAGMLAWNAAASLPPLLQAQLRQLGEGPLLRALVQQQLPSVIPEGPTVPTGEVYSLCRLLHGLLEMQALQAQVLINLAVAADLVPRLWFSCLRVRLACSGSGVVLRA